MNWNPFPNLIHADLSGNIIIRKTKITYKFFQIVLYNLFLLKDWY